MEHYFSNKPKAEPRPIIINFNCRFESFTFHTSSSVFSKDKVDKGTGLLINESKISPTADILDIGCGYGAIGIVLSRLYPKAKITMSDVNERAISLTKKNIKSNNANAQVIRSDLFEKIPGKFSTILSNPPQSAGKKLCFQLIEDSHAHLKKGGSFQLVARHQKGGKHLSQKMQEVFGNVETLGRKSGYHIYYSKML